MITTVQCSICSRAWWIMLKNLLLCYAPIPAHCCDYTPKITDYALGICNYTSKASLIIGTVTLAHARRGLDCHLVARTCDNEVGVAISIRDPYTSPFTSRCK